MELYQTGLTFFVLVAASCLLFFTLLSPSPRSSSDLHHLDCLHCLPDRLERPVTLMTMVSEAGGTAKECEMTGGSAMQRGDGRRAVNSWFVLSFSAHTHRSCSSRIQGPREEDVPPKGKRHKELLQVQAGQFDRADIETELARNSKYPKEKLLFVFLDSDHSCDAMLQQDLQKHKRSKDRPTKFHFMMICRNI